MKRLSCLVLALAVLGAAAFAQPNKETPKTGGAAAAQAGKEAPELAALVSAGKLPPLDQRLPSDPLVVTPIDRVGKYGGTWRMAFRASSAWSFWTYVIKETEIRYAADLRTLVPNLLKGFTASPDNKVFTFNLRHGIKWSNGDPYDADDYAFWWNDMVLNKELYPSMPSEFAAGGKLARFEKIDQYTVRFSFDVPNALFLQRLAQPRYMGSISIAGGGTYGGSIAKPSRYLKQFHPAYASKDSIDKAVKDGKFNTWVDMFTAKINLIVNPEVPVLNAWKNVDTNTKSVMRFERNPYYWKVDTAGNQLPYIDRQEMYLYADAQACLLKALAGEVDFQYREIASLANYPTLSKGADKGGYRIIQTETMNMNNHTIFLNRTTTDPVKKQLYNDLRFRQALSYGIDRDEVNNLLYSGLADSTQVAPPESSASWEQDVAQMYAQYDMAKANGLLDEVGMKWDANHEWRLGPDGKPISFNKIFYIGAEAQELIKATWKKIGINVNNKTVDRTLWEATMEGNDWDMSAYGTDTGGGAYLPLAGSGIFPQSKSWRPNSQWGAWFGTSGTGGIEPPAEVKMLKTLYDEYCTTATPARMVAIEKEAFRTYVGNLLSIGVVNRTKYDVYFIANKKMKNTPNKMIDDTSFYHPAQFFYE